MTFEFKYSKSSCVTSDYIHSLLSRFNINATQWAERVISELFYKEVLPNSDIKDVKSTSEYTDLMKTILFQPVHTLNEMYIRHFNIELIQPDMNLHQIIDHIVLSICKKSFKENKVLTDIDILDQIPNVIECHVLNGYIDNHEEKNDSKEYIIDLKSSDWWSTGSSTIDCPSENSFERKYILTDEVHVKFCNFLYSLGKYLYESSRLGITSLETVLKDIPVIEEKESSDFSIIKRIQLACVSMVKEELIKKIKEYQLRDGDEIPIYLILKSIQNNSFWKSLGHYSKYINRAYCTFVFPKDMLEYSPGNILYDGSFHSINFPTIPVAIYQMIDSATALTFPKTQERNSRWKKVNLSPDQEYYTLVWSQKMGIELPRILKGRFIIKFD